MKNNMKKLVSLLACTAMTTSLLPTASVFATKNAIPAPAGETLLFSEDFNFVVPSDSTYGAEFVTNTYPYGKRPSDGYNNGHISYWGSSSAPELADIDSNTFSTSANSVLFANGVSGAGERSFEIYVPTEKTPTAGIVNVSMNLGYARNNSGTTLSKSDCTFLTDNSGNHTTSKVFGVDTINTLKGNDVTTSKKIDTWYDFKCEIDLDKDTYTAVITEHATGTKVFSKTDSYTLSDFKGLHFANAKSGSGNWENCSPAVDNILITHKEKDILAEQEYDFKQDFESGSNAIVKDPNSETKEIVAPPQFTTHFGGEVRTDDSTNGSKALYVSGGIADGASQISVGDVKTSGKYKLKYSFYPTDKGDCVILDSRQVYEGARGRKTQGTWMSFATSSLGSGRTWYDVELDIDLDADKAKLTFYTKGTKTVVYTQEAEYKDALGVIEFAMNATASGLDKSSRIDNVYFYTIYDNAPEFSASNFSLYAADELQEDFNNVNPLADTIKIKFPQKMKSSTLLGENIYVTDAAGNTVATSATFNNGTECTLSFDRLQSGTYKIHVANLRNMSGYVMGSEYIQEFKIVDNAAQPEYDFKQDFENYTVTTDPNPMPAPPQFASHFGGEVRTDNSTNGTKVLYVSSGIKDGAAQLLVDDVKTSGKYKLTYSFYPTDQGDCVILDSLQTGGARGRVGRGTWMSFATSSLGSGRTWYDVELIIDLDNDKAKLTFYTKGTKTVVYTKEATYTDALGVIEFAMNATTSGPDYSSRIDNVYFYSVYESEPVFDSSNFICYAGDVAQTDINNVSALTDSIKINFPQKMKLITLQSENIYVTDANGDVVEADVTFDGADGCTITFDSLLTPGEMYDINVANLRNKSGYLMSDAFVQSFVVAEGSFDSALKNVTFNDAEVAGIDAFTAGKSLVINYSANNSMNTEMPLTLFVAFYNVTNNIPELVECQMFDCPVDAYSGAENLMQDFEVPAKTFNKVSVMMWNSADRMNPLSSVIDFE